jgi:hypothetical protein
MTVQTVPLEQRPRTAFRRPPTYAWVPVLFAVLLVGGLTWGAVMYWIASI